MARTYEETIYDAAVEAVNDALAQSKLPTPDEIKGNILDNSRNAVEMYNSIAQPRAKWKVPTELVPFQVAYVMLRLHYTETVSAGDGDFLTSDTLWDFKVSKSKPTNKHGQLSYDFAIRDDSCGYVFIEYNGIQHYESIDYFGGNSKLKRQKQHDKLKRDYAKKHGYKLITIKYTYDTYESVAEYLDKVLVA